ncbi:uncharacterized protein LOC112088052 [Eutrema salsugineum]|uniref:uncharacterized protein LOC112088052 n=1 Tax=Eutrema salsugineum TaxID=72664 RepID=UPI000CED0F98|nr:uncharacterized protein LOC112088052 [Eutrema salsugineum]
MGLWLMIGKCVLAAKVVSVEYNPLWYYIACSTCNKVVQPYEEDPENGDLDDESPPLFHCSACDEVFFRVEAKYILVLRVTNESDEELRFLLFDHVARPFLRRSADALAEEVTLKPASEVPSTLSNLVGKLMLLKILTSNDNLKTRRVTYKVEIVVDDEKFVDKFVRNDSSKADNNQVSNHSSLDIWMPQNHQL